MKHWCDQISDVSNTHEEEHEERPRQRPDMNFL
jgi:hypothetical protein